jgi:hypothetical protein
MSIRDLTTPSPSPFLFLPSCHFSKTASVLDHRPICSQSTDSAFTLPSLDNPKVFAMCCYLKPNISAFLFVSPCCKNIDTSTTRKFQCFQYSKTPVICSLFNSFTVVLSLWTTFISLNHSTSSYIYFSQPRLPSPPNSLPSFFVLFKLYLSHLRPGIFYDSCN